MSSDPRIVEPQRAPSDNNAGFGTAGFDPLRLCVYATVALLGWLLGPLAVLFFAGMGWLGYYRARRAGLTRSRCMLRDTRLVLVYLGSLAAVGAVVAVLAVTGNFRIGWW